MMGTYTCFEQNNTDIDANPCQFFARSQNTIDLVFFYSTDCWQSRVSQILHVLQSLAFVDTSRSDMVTKPSKRPGSSWRSLPQFALHQVWILRVRLLPLYVEDGPEHISNTTVKIIAICNLQSGNLECHWRSEWTKTTLSKCSFFKWLEDDVRQDQCNTCKTMT